MTQTEFSDVLKAAKKGFILGAAFRFPFALIAELKNTNKGSGGDTLVRVLQASAQSGTIIASWSALYKLIRYMFRMVTGVDGGVIPVFVAGGLSGQALWNLSPNAYFEIFLYFLKFLAEAVINACHKRGMTASPTVQRLSVFVLLGLLVTLFEKEPDTLNSRMAKLFGFMWK